MATMKPVKGKTKAAPKKATPPAKAAAAKAEPAKVEEKKKPDPPPVDPEDQKLISEAQALTTMAVGEQGLEVAPGFSLMPSLRIAASLVPLRRKANELVAMAERAVIDSPEKYERGVQYLALVKQTYDQLETYRVSVKKPIDDYSKYIQSLFMPLINLLRNDSNRTGGHHVVARKMLAYKQAEEKKAADKAEEERLKRAAEAQTLADQERAAGNTESAAAIEEAAAAAPAPQVQSAVSNVRVAGAAVQTRVSWNGKVEKPMEVLKAIIEGKVPMNVLEWRQAGLNEFARTLKTKGEFFGIAVSDEESLGIRT